MGAVSVGGGASSHAAIIARGLGVPMLTGIDPAVLAGSAGQPGLLDADAGELVVGASQAEPAAQRPPGSGPFRPGRSRPPTGSRLTVCCNVASAAETRRGLAGGAAGVGLLRTEIPFLGAHGWPSAAEHAAQLAPILGLLGGRPATVRLLDFSGDKIPPFLTRPGRAWPRCSRIRRRWPTSSPRLLEAGRAGRAWRSWSRWSAPWTRWPGSVTALSQAAASAGCPCRGSGSWSS